MESTLEIALRIKHRVPVYVCLVTQLCLTLCDPTKLLCPWVFSGKNTKVGCSFLLQGTFLTQGSNPVFHVSCITGSFFVSSVQLPSCVWLYATPRNAAHQASLSITNSRSLLRLMSIELVMPSNHLILCRPLLLPPSTFPSIKVFSNESVLHIKWPKYWSCSCSISPSKEYSGLISFRIHWFDLLAVQGTLENQLQHHSSKASILQCSAFFIVQLSHPYMTTGKTTAWTTWTFVGKGISLLFNMLSRLVIALYDSAIPSLSS